MTDKLNKSISQIWEDEYVVPLYQRNYAWQEDQIQQLLQDIYDNSKNPDSHYFIGSLVVLQRPDNIYEVIDGQQRLTTLHLICKSLGLLDAPRLSYDSRPEVEEFFKGLFTSASSRDFADGCKKRDCRKIFRLVDAIDIVETTNIHVNTGRRLDSTISLSTMPGHEKQAFKEYLNNNVIIVRTVLPSDTDVAAYFEIMNNRGEQLQEHEIVKALMMRKLNGRERAVFSAVWDACSQMNVPIQKGLSPYRHHQEKPLFGKDYDKLNLEYLNEYDEQMDSSDEMFDIDQILSSQGTSNDSGKKEQDAEVRYESIIDFPNFLMRIFKMFSPDCPLNSNVILSEYKRMEKTENFSSMKFIRELLNARVLFDRYIIKSQGDGEEDENLRWTMRKPYRYVSNSGSLKFRNTYSTGKGEEAENELEEYAQKRLIMQESMLQVTFRNKKYKNWLFDVLVWLKGFEVDKVEASAFSIFLDEWTLSYYQDLEEKTQPAEGSDWAFEALGTDTPHFVFNFIDYLYWLAKEKNINISGCEYVKDFVFKYYNSIEHHLPQSYRNTDDINVDNIANLCLISRRANSSLNDKAPKEKAVLSPGLYPKRTIMYLTTIKGNGLWGGNEISAHYKDIKALVDNRQDIIFGTNQHT